jgi:radical SAM protein with 4Fe4S-binding SPASM domain|tara:strand:- start:2249 stop:3202 length:954 start_codon:yes stop_codon:yes gene_type:complete
MPKTDCPNIEIRFEVTNRCDAACVFCPRDLQTRKQGVLGMGLYKKLLEEAIAWGGVSFVSLENYGEPFLDPFLFKRAKYAKERGMYVATISTGSTLHKGDAINQTLDWFDKIRFSYYGITKDVYEGLHRNLNFETATKNIRNLIEAKEKSNSKLRIEMYFLLMPENEHQMEDWLKMYEPLVDGVSVWKPHNWSDGRAYRPINEGSKVSCGRPFNGPLQVQWDGKIVPCCYDYNSEIVLGDCNEKTLKEVFTGKSYEKFRNAHRDGEFFRYPFCDGCDQLNKRKDVLIYSNIKDSEVGAVNTSYDVLVESTSDPVYRG